MQRNVVLQIDVDDNDEKKCGDCQGFHAWHDIARCDIFNTSLVYNCYGHNRCQRCIDSEVSDE